MNTTCSPPSYDAARETPTADQITQGVELLTRHAKANDDCAVGALREARIDDALAHICCADAYRACIAMLTAPAAIVKATAP